MGREQEQARCALDRTRAHPFFCHRTEGDCEARAFRFVPERTRVLFSFFVFSRDAVAVA